MNAFHRAIKRFFDVVASLCGVIFFLLPMIVIALLIGITSGWPVFFFQTRIGRHGRLFCVIKFRTMTCGAESQGTITTSKDMRITGIGRLLRAFKLDELPQLINVLSGSMSFVGPRPDVAGYADQLTGENRQILDLRPGITGPATLFYAFEEKILEQVADPKNFNDTVIYPHKVILNLKYANQWSLWNDIGYIVVSIIPTFSIFFPDVHTLIRERSCRYGRY